MGFLDRFRGNQEAEVKVEKVEFSQLPDWLAMHKREMSEGLGERAKPVLSRVPQVLEELSKRLDEMGGAEMQKDIQQRIKSLVSSSRDNYVSKVGRLLQEIDIEAEPLELSDEINDALEEVKKVDAKYGQRVNFGFKKELGKVKRELNNLVGMSDEVNGLMKERREKLKILKEAEKELGKVNDKLGELKVLEDREKEASNAVMDAKFQKKKAGKRVDDVEHSDRAESLASINLELEDLKAKKHEIETFVLNVLGPLKRIFKKYARAVKKGRASGINVDRYADDPVETYLRGEHTLPDLLAKMQKAIQTNLLDLDPAESEKSLKKIRTISFSYLEKTRSEYNTTVSRMRTLESQSKRMDIRGEIEKIHREIEGLDGKIESGSKRAERIKGDIEGKKQELEELNRGLAKKLSEFIGGRCELV